MAGYIKVQVASTRNVPTGKTVHNALGVAEAETVKAFRLQDSWIASADTLIATIDPVCSGHTLMLMGRDQAQAVISQGNLWNDLPKKDTSVSAKRVRERATELADNDMSNLQQLVAEKDSAARKILRERLITNAEPQARTELTEGTVYDLGRNCSESEYKTAKVEYARVCEEVAIAVREGVKRAASANE